MPSQVHEALVQLFRNRPELAPELLREALQVTLPTYDEARIDSADPTEVQPAEYRADLVVLLVDERPVLGIVVEVQLSTDERKRYVWPAYGVTLRARFECPVCVLVVAVDEAVARWAAMPIDLGGGSVFTPLVLGPSGVPAVTDAVKAREDPELAVLSAMAHGRDADTERSVQIALAAQMASVGLDDDRSRLYCDLIISFLSEAARQAVQTMDPAKYEYQSDFARKYVAQGRAEGVAQGVAQGRAEGVVQGVAQGRAGLIIKQLGLRFGSLNGDIQRQIAAAALEELDAIGERLLTASTLQEALRSG